MKVFWIDLFCGAGGTTTGIHLSSVDANVVACVNHDKNAILSHKLNYPNCRHYTEDIRNPEVVYFLSLLVRNLRKKYPGCIINLWASLECTNYSKAKGGLPRDADSRTLANHLFMYLEHLKPDGLFIENVIEFMAWGPLDDSGRPISRKAGIDYIKWVKSVKSFGYEYDWKELNAADFGGYTSRQRYFGQFIKPHLEISWPEPTHEKNPTATGLFTTKKKWLAVKDVLDLDDEGVSIFERKKPLVENTLKRIYAGLIKFVAGGEKAFIQKHFSGRPYGKVISIENPTGTICTTANQSIVKTIFLNTYYGNSGKHSIDEPSPTVTTKDRITKVEAKFLTSYYNGGGDISSIEAPNPTLTGVPKQRLTSCDFIDQQYGQSKPKSTDEPAGTLTSNPKLALVKAKPWLMDTSFSNVGNDIEAPAPTILASRKHHYLMNPQYANKGASLEKPCFTLIARMDKAPPYLMSTEAGEFAIVVYETDTPMMVKIKEFMAIYGIVDIKMRMLNISELLRIQGFPDDYKMIGSQTEMKKFIGNSVHTMVAKKIVEANYRTTQKSISKAA